MGISKALIRGQERHSLWMGAVLAGLVEGEGTEFHIVRDKLISSANPYAVDLKGPKRSEVVRA